MDKTRPLIRLAPPPHGQKLVWRNPASNAEIARQLARGGIDPIPNNLTIGYLTGDRQ